MSTEIDLVKKSPPILMNVNLWKQLQVEISNELNRLKDEIDKKRRLYNVYAYDQDEDELDIIDMSESFGYSPIRILDNSLDYLRRDVDSIYYKIINKSTLKFFKYMFKLIPYIGDVFIIYYDDYKLIRAIDWESTVANIVVSDIRDLFLGFVPYKYYSSIHNLIC